MIILFRVSKSFKGLYLGVILITLFFSLSSKLFALPYNPSETLDPSCAPGDASCYVNVLPDQIGNSGEILTTDGTTVSWGSSIAGLTMSGDLAVNGGDITSTSTLTINSATTNALTIDSGTTGAINIGTGANAKTVTIGNTTGASALTLNSGTGSISIGTSSQARAIFIGTGGAVQTITMGSDSVASTLLIKSGITTGTALSINTTSLTTGKSLDISGPSDTDIFEVGYDNTDPWDGVRVAIGKTGKNDQLYIDGRINYSWNMIWEDFIEYSSILTTTDGKYNTLYYDVNASDACSVRSAVAVGSTMTSSGATSFYCQTSAGNNAWLGSNGSAITSSSLLPVLETRLQATSNTDHRFVIGFMDIANDAATLGASDTNSAANEIMFRKAAGETYWEGVTRSNSGTENVTEFTGYSTSVMRKLRIEVETAKVRFYIDDTLVATHAQGIPASTLGLGFYAGTAITGATLRSTILDYIRIWSDDPLPGQISEEDLAIMPQFIEDLPFISPVIQEVSNYLRDGVEKIIDGVVRIVHLFVKSLTVGSRERPSGVTFFDELTGEPYCLSIRGGEQIIKEGECGNIGELEEVENNEDLEIVQDLEEVVEVQEVDVDTQILETQESVGQNLDSELENEEPSVDEVVKEESEKTKSIDNIVYSVSQ